MKKKILIILSILMALFVTAVVVVFINLNSPSTYLDNIEKKLMAFRAGIDKQTETVNTYDFTNVSKGEFSEESLELTFFSAPFLDLYTQLIDMKVPNKEDLQSFHEDVQDLNSDYMSLSNDFTDAVEAQDEYLIMTTTEEMGYLVEDYKDLLERLDELKEKYN